MSKQSVQQPLLQSSVSHDPSEIILISWFGALFTVNFDQFNVSLLNKSINFFKTKNILFILLTPHFWTAEYV